MKLGIIAPVGLLQKYSTLSQFHICYPEILFMSTEYLDFYKKRSKLGDIVILDFTVKVPRRATPASLLNKAIELLNPTYIVMPCVDFSLEKTVISTLEYAKDCYLPRIGCLQGTNITELASCYKSISGESEFIGLPTSCEKIMPRYRLVDTLNIVQPCILLEVYKSFRNEVVRDERILGIGTALPIRLSRDLRKLSEDYPEPPELDFYSDKDPFPDLTFKNIDNAFDICEGIL